MVRTILRLSLECLGVGFLCFGMLLAVATMMDMGTNLSGGLFRDNGFYALGCSVLCAFTGMGVLAKA